MPPRSRQTAAAPGQRTVAQVPKKTFVFKQQAGHGLKVAPRHRGSRTSVARVTVVRNTFQKGDFKDRVTGTLSIEWVPRYGSNETAKEKTSPILLAEESRFNNEKKVYRARIYTYKQAMKFVNALKEVDAAHEKDLTDTTIDKALFDFPEYKGCDINFIKVVHHDNDVYYAFGGQTYAFKEDLKDYGFKFYADLDDNLNVQLWMIKHTDLEMEECETMKAKMEDYGWNVETFDDMVNEIA